MEKNRFLSIMLILLLGFSLAACGDDDDDLVNNGNGSNSGGNSQTSYTFKQLAGYWVNMEQWNDCKTMIRNMPASGQVYSDVYLNDDILSKGVEGYYLTSEGKAYEIFLTTTTTKYANNDVAGNKVLKQWSCLDNKTVYFMNVSGGKNNYSCSIDGNDLNIGWNNHHTIQSTTLMVDAYQTKYTKVTLSL